MKRSRVLFASGFGIVIITRLNALCAANLFDPSSRLPLYSNRCALDSALRFWQWTPLEVCVALDLFLPIIETPLSKVFISNSMLKCFVELGCDCLEQIQSQTINYLKHKTNLLESKPKEPWCITDTKVALQNIPALIGWCKQHKFLPQEISFIVSHDSSSGLPVHTDQGPLIAKVNVPILNTQGNITRWWDNDSVIAETPMDSPVVFNSSIPHSVDIHSDALPRVVMAVMMRNENVLLKMLGGE